MPNRPDVCFLDFVDEAARFREAFETRLDGVRLRVVPDRRAARRAIVDAEVVATFSLTEDLLDRAERLAWVHACNAGVDTYPVDALADRGVALTNSAGVHAEQLGQQVLGYLLVFERRIHEGIRQQRAGEWSRYEGGILSDDTLGVVGLGAIGSRIGELGAAFGMEVIGTKRDPTTAPACADDCYPPERLDAVLDRADYLVLACPLTPETEGLVGREELARLDDDAVLVNVARGPVVDQDALVAALDAGEIRGAALDVTDPEPLPADSPLRSMHDVIVTPHVGGTSPDYFERVMDVFAANYRAHVDGEEFTNRVV